MKLNAQQLEILALLKLDADRSPKDLAKSLGITERTVRYNLERMVGLGFARRFPMVNVYPLGLRYVNVYFSLAGADRKYARQLISRLERSPRVSWLAQLGGDFHYGAAFLVRRYEEVADLFSSLGAKATVAIRNKEITQHLALHLYSLKFLSSRSSKSEVFGYWTTGKDVEADALDFDILNLLASKQMAGGRELSRALGRPHSTIDARLKRLRRNKVYLGQWLQASFSLLHYQAFKVLLSTNAHDEKTKNHLRSFCENHPRIDHLIECVGRWDFEVGIVVQDSTQVLEVVESLMDEFGPIIQSTQTLPILRLLKLQQCCSLSELSGPILM
ncbi:MAG: Lrp/AsnC family transcriptional regulator [Bdellovibrionales bacterium]|nr:Lrp/AsnC family transcriptional regulator [Bdellovibrionales bacterium]